LFARARERDWVRVATLVGNVSLRQPIPDVDGPIVDGWFDHDAEGAWKVFPERPARSQQAVLAVALRAVEHRTWVIEAGKQVGLVRLSTKDRAPGQAALLYYVAREHRGAGYGTTAVRMIVQHAFADLGFEALLADVLLTNAPSTRLLVKLRFERTGERKLARTDRGPEQLEEWRLRRTRDQDVV
jgi:RimJ/RimL family protein N-acetyltransferase